MQRYLIDGHNLIPHIHGLSLSDLEDEMGLVKLLQVYARVRRRSIEVYFDDAPPGYSGQRRFGMVLAVFTPASSTADAAIRARLAALGNEARGVTVVSSDRQVLADARARGAAQIRADAFADDLMNAQSEEPPANSARRGTRRPAVPPALPADEVEAWLKLFQQKKK